MSGSSRHEGPGERQCWGGSAGPAVVGGRPPCEEAEHRGAVATPALSPRQSSARVTTCLNVRGTRPPALRRALAKPGLLRARLRAGAHLIPAPCPPAVPTLPTSPAEQVGSLCPLPLLPVPLTRGPLSRAATGCSSAGPKGGVRTRLAGGRSTRQGPPLHAMPLGASLDAKQICCCCRRFRNHVRHKGQELCRPGVHLFHRIRIVFYRHVIL